MRLATSRAPRDLLFAWQISGVRPATQQEERRKQ
jgi:hypothetical protein